MDCEAERILQISLWKLTDVRQRQCLGSSLRRNLLVSRALDSVLSSTELSYCAYRTDYELEVDIDSVFKTIENQTKSKRNCMDNGGEGKGQEKGKEGKGQETSEGLDTRKTRRCGTKQTI